MTGLSPTTDTILSLSCYITSSLLVPLEPEGYHAVIRHTQSQLAAMNDWCIDTHGRTGLTKSCLESTTTAETAAEGLLAYIQHYLPAAKTALLAGNSIHQDRAFLCQPPWTRIVEYCHYRILDISSLKEAVRRWCGDEVLREAPRKTLGHTAKEDVEESLEEGRFYMELFQRLGAGDGGGEKAARKGT